MFTRVRVCVCVRVLRRRARTMFRTCRFKFAASAISATRFGGNDRGCVHVYASVVIDVVSLCVVVVFVRQWSDAAHALPAALVQAADELLQVAHADSTHSKRDSKLRWPVCPC